MGTDVAAPIELSGADRALFASDVHLDDGEPRTAAAFFGALAREAAGATHLFLLGDLFEAWVGDDDPSAVGNRMATTLRSLARAGLRVYLMRGNRDFLLDVALPGAAARFSERCGATMLQDPCAALLFGRPSLLAHGDALCTDDREYQAFRSLSRSADWQHAFLARPLDQRVAEAAALRARSEAAKAAKSSDIMDVNVNAVEGAIREAGATLLIHGHTHRPALHRLNIDGIAAQRWVLPDWDADAGRGGMLLATREGLRAIGGWDPRP